MVSAKKRWTGGGVKRPDIRISGSKQMDKIKILIADDHEIIRYGISTYLASAEDIEVVGEASDGQECLGLFRNTIPDICLLDITMPGMGGIETACNLKEINPECKVVILSMHLDADLLAEALKCQIDGYLLKNTDKGQLLQCVRVIHNGQHVYSSAVAELLVEAFSSDKYHFKNLENKITQREHEVLSLIVQGKTSQEIAEQLFISHRTVETHRSNLLRKLGMKNTAELVRYALESRK